MAKTDPTTAPAQDATSPQASAASQEAISTPTSTTPRATAVSVNTTYTLNSSNHPDITERLVLGDTPTVIPNATASLLEFLGGLPGVTVTTPDAK